MTRRLKPTLPCQMFSTYLRGMIYTNRAFSVAHPIHFVAFKFFPTSESPAFCPYFDLHAQIILLFDNGDRCSRWTRGLCCRHTRSYRSVDLLPVLATGHGNIGRRGWLRLGRNLDSLCAMEARLTALSQWTLTLWHRTPKT